MAELRLLFIFLCGCIFVNSEVQPENAPTYASEINAVLNHLNSTPFKVYTYKEATLVNAATKADITELALDVDVDCVNNYPDVPCTEKVLTCNAFVRNTPESGSQVLNDVNCKPKPEIIIEEPVFESTVPTEAEGNEPKSVALSNEAVSSEVGEHFVAIRKDTVPCLGCPFDLNPNAEGVEELIDLALRHLETERSNKQALVKVLKLQQQVVAGVKYILIAEIAPTVCAKDSNVGIESCPKDSEAVPSICQITYLHKPWISKDKHVIANNCTVSQEFVKSDLRKSDISNEIDTNNKHTKPKSDNTPNFDHIAESGTIEDLGPLRLGDLESQILVENEDSEPQNKKTGSQGKVVVPSTVESQIQVESQSRKRDGFAPSRLGDLESQILVESEDLEPQNKKTESLQAKVMAEGVVPSTVESQIQVESQARKRDDFVPSRLGDLESQILVESEDLESQNKKTESLQDKVMDEGVVPSTVESQIQIESQPKKRNDFVPSEGSTEIDPATTGEVPKRNDFVPSEASTEIDPATTGEVPTSTTEDTVTTTETTEAATEPPKRDDSSEENKNKSDERKDEKKVKNENSSEEKKNSEENDGRTKRSDESGESSESTTTVSSDLKKADSSSEENSSEEQLRPKRAIRQLEKITPEEKSLVKNLADFAAAALDNIDDDNQKRIILQILGAKKMVGDDGVYYHLIMRMGISRCLEDTPPNPYENCREKLFENYTKICKVQVYVNDDFGSPKVVKSQCQNIKRDKNDSNRTNYSRFRRETLLGGQSEIDKNSNEVQFLLREGIKHLNSKSSSSNKHKPVEVLSATTQVVAGSLLRIKTKISETDCPKDDQRDLAECNVLRGASPKTCEVKIWDKSWQNFRQFTITCDGDSQEYKVETKIRTKRQIPGGQFEVSKDDEQVLSYLEGGLSHLDSESSHENKLKVHEVISATSQVVAGSIYRIKAKVVLSDCKKAVSTKRGECGTLKGAEPKTCNFVVFEQSWVPNSRETNVTCDNEVHSFRNKREIAPNEVKRETLIGERTDIDNVGHLIRALVDRGIKQFNSKSRYSHKYKPVEVLSATSEVVKGITFRIKTKIIETDCPKDDEKFETCDELRWASPVTCEVEVWEKPWEGFTKYSITCEGDSDKFEDEIRLERQKPGVQYAVSKHDSELLECLEGGLRHLDSQSPHENKLKIHEIISATSEVMEGMIYRIEAKIVLSDCNKTVSTKRGECGTLTGAEPKTCNFVVFDQSWVPNRVTNVTCDNEVHSFKNKREVPNGQFNEGTKPNSRSKRRIRGGQNPVSTDDEQVLTYLEGGLSHLDSESPHENKFKVHEIISATSQVVSGHIYRITAKVVLSDCKKTVSTKRGDCGTLKDAQPKTCDFVVFEQLWIPDSKVTNVTCDNEVHSFRNKRQVLGGQFEVSKNDELVDTYLESALSELDSKLKNDNKLKVQEVVSVTKQIVAGHIYRITAKIILSDCKKTVATDRGKCGTLEGAEPKTCEFKVLQPISGSDREITVTCGDEAYNFRAKRDLTPTHSGLLGHDDRKLHFTMFNEFIRTYGKKYSKKEFKYRFKVFSDNMFHVKVLNTYEQGTATYGVTRFADLTQQEFSKYLGLRMDLRNENEPPFAQAQIPDIEIPTEFDWRKKGAVTEVKNQEQCGSCWAFSVTGNVEGQYALKHGSLLEFSEQELVDCDTEDQGCNGGLMDTAYRQIEKLGGLETEQDYPYDAEDEKCHFNKSLAQVQLTGALNISHNETDMAKWLVANGPISIAINANAMQFYMGGVSHPFKFLCNPNNLDHGVLIVGYGVHNYPLFKKSLPYWIVKNSWGTSWGEQGYYRVYRGDGTCGLNQTPSSAIVA